VEYDDFGNCPGSFGVAAMKALLGPLLKKNYSAVVLNARDGSEVALMLEAGMRVVGVYSEHHDKFPGGVVPNTKQEIADAVKRSEAESQAPVVAGDVGWNRGWKGASWSRE
jgi:hypothetical protein